ncbi:hypothetical protein HYR82_05530 [Candidatus Peregrinibacteria bacterium]|nr:hypothetical protein [Candidatus Peregrinibacteria bacterium]
MLRRPVQLFNAMTRWERWALIVFAALFVLAAVALVHKFYVENTILVPTTGGTYIEGSVGELRPLNPWFTIQNDVNRDIVSLVFAGLLKYNPQTKNIEDDLATMQIASDAKTYTLRLKDNLLWHDSTPKDPHPVTADDVLFTFGTIQHAGFPNPLLQQNFRGVAITKLDDRTVQFLLDQPYSFFPSNLTLGLLPARSFEGIPTRKMDQALDFAYHPIGAGPYRFKSLVQTDLSTEVTIERFPRSIPPLEHLDRIVFRIFSDYSSLLTDLRTLQGVRLVPRNKKGEPIIPNRFHATNYTLPQYVALFFNLDHPALQDPKLRLGLQLGTNKQEIADGIHEPYIVDTPLLEIDVSDWRYHFDPDAAQGALFASRWNLPEKIRLQHLLENTQANHIGPLRAATVVLAQTGSSFTITGSLADVPLGSKINGDPIAKNPHGTGSWIVELPAQDGTGALKLGENILRLTDPHGKVVDSFYVLRARDADDYARAMEEQRLVQLFLASKAGTAPPDQRIGPGDFFLESATLRRRTPLDPVSIRTNDRGKPLTLTLLTSPAPAAYRDVSERIKQQWAKLGVAVTVEIPATRQEFQDRLLRRQYDVLLFGQSLLDNLDSFPYWHSSTEQKVTANPNALRSNAYNLSQYASFPADALLETIRRTRDEKERADALKKLRDILKTDVPAVFLYSPLYTFAHHENVQGIELGALSVHSDRFLTLYKWYVKQDRTFAQGKSWLSFFGWVRSLMQR